VRRPHDRSVHRLWRLPERNELLSIVDPSRASPALDPLFTAPPGDTRFRLWTATPSSTSGAAWIVYMDAGNSSRALPSELLRVWCVRTY
jgi:hypothetical protein